jgi:hypothetical protein
MACFGLCVLLLFHAVMPTRTSHVLHCLQHCGQLEPLNIREQPFHAPKFPWSTSGVMPCPIESVLSSLHHARFGTRTITKLGK